MESLEQWKEQFDKRFFNPSIPSPNDLKKFISSLLAAQRAELVEKIKTALDIGTSTHGNCCTCSECRHAHDECKCEFNRGVLAVLALLTGEGK